MTDSDSDSEIVEFNRRAWDHVADAGDRYFRAITHQQIEAARGGNWSIRVTPVKRVPKSWLEPLRGQRVLLLASGGGQQSPILAAVGADVVVFDISEKQLQRDRQIAKREGLNIETVSGDMADLSTFADCSFDLVINPCSVCYCPEVKPIWTEVFRVLKSEGRFISGLINPLYYLFDAQKLDRGIFEVRHRIPYRDADLGDVEHEVLGAERPREFGHSLHDLIGLQLSAGFQLVGFFEDGWGDNDPLSKRISTFFATCCRKP